MIATRPTADMDRLQELVVVLREPAGLREFTKVVRANGAITETVKRWQELPEDAVREGLEILERCWNAAMSSRQQIVLLAVGTDFLLACEDAHGDWSERCGRLAHDYLVELAARDVHYERPAP